MLVPINAITFSPISACLTSDLLATSCLSGILAHLLKNGWDTNQSKGIVVLCLLLNLQSGVLIPSVVTLGKVFVHG